MRIPLVLMAAATALCVSADRGAAFGWFDGWGAPPSRPMPSRRGEEPGGWRPSLWGNPSFDTPRGGYYTNDDFERPRRRDRDRVAPHRFAKPAVAQAIPTRTEVPGELVIALNPGVPLAEGARLARRHRLTLLWSKELSLLGQTVLSGRVNVQSLDDTRKAIAADTRVASVQPNFAFRLLGPPAPLGAPQYAAATMHLADAHLLATGTGALVAVIDSAVDGTHPELAGRVAETVDTLGKAGTPGATTAPGAHGTAVAGIIAAHAKLAGVAPDARILAIRAFAEPAGVNAGGSTVNILEALESARARNARVVNMSFEGPADPLVARALAAGRERGMIFVAAGGNGGPGASPAFPASNPNVIAAAATGANDAPIASASRGDYLAVAAPGVDILVPTPGGAYAVGSGTSYAAAHVSGLVALLLQLDPALDAAGVRRLLTESARKVDGLAAERGGAGVVDAAAAVQLARSGKTAAIPGAPGVAAVGGTASTAGEPPPRPQ